MISPKEPAQKESQHAVNAGRCAWVPKGDALYTVYHDEEWGRPSRDDRHLFEMLTLEGFQAGLSWRTILHKRSAFQEAFDYFDPKIIARYDEAKIESLMGNPGIIRNRLKIRAAVKNAQVFLDIVAEFGSFNAYLWAFVDNRVVPPENPPLSTSTKLSDRVSRDLKRRGMRFTGTTIIYAYLQAVGVVNNHESGCFLTKTPQEMDEKCLDMKQED